MRKRTRRTLIAGAGAALTVAGGGAALAAQSSGDARTESKAIVNDAAKQLGVDPTKLSDALEQALENRVDAAVKDGRLTEAQGEEMKARIQTGAFPLFGARDPGRGGHHGFGHLDAAATYLGITDDALRTSLQGGKSLAQVAADRGKSVDGLVAALVADKTKKLDEAVSAGRLTKERRDERVSGLKERLTVLVNSTHLRGGPGLRDWPGFRGKHGSGGQLKPPGGSSSGAPAPPFPEAA